jgi:hypothetical protein
MTYGAEFRVDYPGLPPLLQGVPELEQHELWAAHEGARLRRFQLDPAHWEFAAAVDIEAERAYNMLAAATGRSIEEIRSQTGDCGHVSLILQQLLQCRRNIGTQLMEFDGSPLNHFFLRTTKIPDVPYEDFNLDGTWQQYVNFSTDLNDRAHVFIAPVSKTRQAVQAEGCLKPYRNYDFRLEAAKPVNYTYEDFADDPLTHIFESEGWAHSS